MFIIESSFKSPLALDNDIFTELRQKKPYILEKLQRYYFENKDYPPIPSLVVFEANFGIQKSLAKSEISPEQADSHIQVISNLSARHSVIDFDQKSAEIAAYVFGRLSQSDRNKHWRDVFIVATATSHNYGVASRNRKDMELIASHLPESLVLRLAVWKP